ncbi:MAG: hypothetical protein K6F50_00785 [Kiritimatiellae bacterium]|nr:hypothetical protein [Kiritimatiellia bacterium]
MKRTTNIGVKRRIAILFALGHAVLIALVALSFWAIMKDDAAAVPAMDDGGPGAGSMSRPPAIHSLEIEDGGDGPLEPSNAPHFRNSASSGEGPGRNAGFEADDSRRPLRHPDFSNHPSRRRSSRFLLTVGGCSIIFLSVGGLLFWHIIAGALDRSAENATRFTADVAHELKTPLAVMQSVVEHAIRHSGGDEAVEKFGADVLEEVKRLKNLVHRLLILAQSDAGKLKLKKERVDISELAKLLAEDLSLVVGEESVSVSVAEGLAVTGDRSFLTQALQNIISNAVKYNREGFTIGFKLAKVGSAAEITVSNGVDPLAPPDISRVFDRFYRGETARGSKLEGAGLGLSLAKEVIESSGGALSAALDGDRISFKATLPLS